MIKTLGRHPFSRQKKIFIRCRSGAPVGAGNSLHIKKIHANILRRCPVNTEVGLCSNIGWQRRRHVLQGLFSG